MLCFVLIYLLVSTPKDSLWPKPPLQADEMLSSNLMRFLPCLPSTCYGCLFLSRFLPALEVFILMAFLKLGVVVFSSYKQVSFSSLHWLLTSCMHH